MSMVRDAILDDLASRYKQGDKSVIPATKERLHRFFQPQKNYFAGVGEIDCPTFCGGRVRYERSAYNGRVRANCSTKGCVAWME